MKSYVQTSRYEARGVSASKSEVHAAVAKMDKGIFPGAFCTIHPDYLGGSRAHCIIQHADGAGTKSSLAYLVWKTTGDINVWRGIAADSLFMNLDDAGCAGALGPFLVDMTIGRNKALIPGEVIRTIIEECQNICDWLTDNDMPCIFTGGETADVGDLVRTIIVDNSITTRFRRSEVIDASRIRAPAYIVGFSSTGRAIWEPRPNSGMGSNGLTNARHDTLAKEYRRYPETFAPETDEKLIYCGDYSLTDILPGSMFSIASALLSRTRDYLPLIQRIVPEIGRKRILGFIHCSGGGQTKIGKFGHAGSVYVKDNLFPVPPLFSMLQKVRKLPWDQMYTSYNMGHRLEAVVKSEKTAERMITISKDCGIDARIVGRVEWRASTMRHVIITDPTGRCHNYSFD